jgi:hypothetical protein
VGAHSKFLRGYEGGYLDPFSISLLGNHTKMVLTRMWATKKHSYAGLLRHRTTHTNPSYS